MVLLKRTSVAVFGLVLVMVVSACGSTPPSSTGGGSTTSAPTPTPVASTVQTAQATVNGKSVTILTDDVFSARYAWLTHGKVTSDGLKPHDDLLAEFPYLGLPHTQPEGTSPSTNGFLETLSHETTPQRHQ